MNARAHGCYGPCFWPVFPFALGLGLGVAAAAASQSHSYPAYVYTAPSYSYNPTAVSDPAPSSGAGNALVNPEVWVPSTSGPGHWVPDPAPYAYSQLPRANSNPQTTVNATGPRTVSLIHTAGSVPVYVVSN